jgi:hypothetical protein
MTSHLFAVETYDDSDGARPVDALPALPPGNRLACAVHLFADDALLAFIEGADEPSVRAALIHSGWRFDRIIAGEWVTPPMSDQVT